MIGGKMIGHRPISTSQHHPGAQRRQLRTGAIEAEQGQRGHGGRKPGKGMNLATSPQNECENRRRRPSRGLAHTPGTPIFALFRWTSERAASIRCPDGGSGQGSFASFLKGPLPPSGHRIERGTIDLQSDINCLPERSLLGAFGKQHDDYDHDVFNSAGSTLATPHFGPENGVHLTQHLPSPDRRRKLQEGTTSRPLGLETRKCPPTLKRSESCESADNTKAAAPAIRTEVERLEGERVAQKRGSQESVAGTWIAEARRCSRNHGALASAKPHPSQGQAEIGTRRSPDARPGFPTRLSTGGRPSDDLSRQDLRGSVPGAVPVRGKVHGREHRSVPGRHSAHPTRDLEVRSGSWPLPGVWSACPWPAPLDFEAFEVGTVHRAQAARLRRVPEDDLRGVVRQDPPGIPSRCWVPVIHIACHAASCPACQAHPRCLGGGARASSSTPMRRAGSREVVGSGCGVFTNLRETVYEILPGRGFEQAASVLGKNYAGIGVDGWAPYR